MAFSARLGLKIAAAVVAMLVEEVTVRGVSTCVVRDALGGCQLATINKQLLDTLNLHDGYDDFDCESAHVGVEEEEHYIRDSGAGRTVWEHSICREAESNAEGVSEV